MAGYRIPFNKPCLTGSELLYAAKAIILGHTSGDGAFTKNCQALLEQIVGTPKALLTTSCTHALEMGAMLLDLKPGDEVIVPSFAFVSTVNAFILRGARPVFADIRPDTMNLDERQLESLITDRTRVIVPLHYAGVACEMDAILEIARRYKLAVVEDNAHGLFASYQGTYLGTFGCVAAQSFHETKNITCGEGGALLINDDRLIERAEILRDKGTNRKKFMRGEVDKYTWVDIGSSYPMSDILAAFLLAQLEKRVDILHRRRAVWNYYDRHLAGWAEQNGVQLPSIPGHCEQSYHMYYLVLPSSEVRQALIEHLKSRSILSVFHYTALHSSTMGLRFGAHPEQCPVATRISDCLLRLPFYNDLAEEDLAYIVKSIREFRLAAPRENIQMSIGQSADLESLSSVLRGTVPTVEEVPVGPECRRCELPG